ncbi:MAG: OPT/YSL family transporter [Treponemataceae bacterium]
MKFKHLTLRAILLSAFGSLLISASSMYVALRMSALPWPTIFVSVLSLALIKLFKNGNLHEVNVAQTGMSSGAMVAGGVAFTIPGLWISGVFESFDKTTMTWQSWALPKFFPILFATIAGTLAGTAICYISRKKFIEKDALPFPIGTAATETLKAGDEGGKKSFLLFGTMGITTIFTLLRDSLKIIPQSFSTKIKGFPLELASSPMAIGIGYIIGFMPCLWWLLGGITAHFLFGHWGLSTGTFASAEAVAAFNLSVAVGLMVGSGIGILVNFIMPLIKKYKHSQNTDEKKVNKKSETYFLLISACLAFIFTLLARIPVLPSLFLIIGVVFACYMSANITGLTGINPMEIFAILVLLAIRIFVPFDNQTAFFIACITAVACGFAGDMLNDYKTGYDLETDAPSQTISQIIGALVGCLVSTVAILAIIAKYGGVGAESGLSAVQAHTVTSMIGGIGDPVIFTSATFIGMVLYLSGIPAMIFGIGMLLPFGLSTAIFIGGLTSLIVKKLKKDDVSGQIIGAGLLGGEGITSTLIAIVQMFL